MTAAEIRLRSLSYQNIYISTKKDEIRQRSALPGGRPPSTIDAIELNFCVRYGNRWILNAIATGFRLLFSLRSYPQNRTIYSLMLQACFSNPSLDKPSGY